MMNKKGTGFRRTLIVLTALTGMSMHASAQVGVGITTPDPSAQLQIESENKGLLIPRVTSTALVTSPATGLMVYQTGGTAGFYYNKGTSGTPDWQRVADASATGIGVAAVDSIKIAPGAVTSTHLAPGSITPNLLGTGGVKGWNVAVNSLTGSHIMASSIQTDHIGSGVVTMGKINSDNATDGQVIGYSSTNGVSWVTPAAGGSSSQPVYGFASNANQSSSAPGTGGSLFAFPHSKKLKGITVDANNTTFTVSTAGVYRIHYSLKAAVSSTIGTRLMLNGSPYIPSQIVAGWTHYAYNSTTIAELSAGSTIGLQIYAVDGTSTLSMPGNGGATMLIERIADYTPEP